MKNKMKLADLKEGSSRGTYAGVRFDTNTQTRIDKYMKKNNIPNRVPTNKLHTTVLYSRKFLPNYKPIGKLVPPLIGHPKKLVIWKTNPPAGGPSTNCLILIFDCKELVKRHKQLMKEHSATYDYDEYVPHITLSYDIEDITNVDDLQDCKTIGNIMIVEEYAQELDLNWAEKHTTNKKKKKS